MYHLVFFCWLLVFSRRFVADFICPIQTFLVCLSVATIILILLLHQTDLLSQKPMTCATIEDEKNSKIIKIKRRETPTHNKINIPTKQVIFIWIKIVAGILFHFGDLFKYFYVFHLFYIHICWCWCWLLSAYIVLLLFYKED